MSDQLAQDKDLVSLTELKRLFSLTQRQLKRIRASGKLTINEVVIIGENQSPPKHAILSVGNNEIAGVQLGEDWFFPRQKIYNLLYTDPQEATNDKWVGNQTQGRRMNLLPTSIPRLAHVLPVVKIAGQDRTSTRLMLLHYYSPAEVGVILN